MPTLGEAICASKVPYDDAKRARKAARGLRGLKPYLCRYCKKWHLGHDRKAEQRSSPRR